MLMARVEVDCMVPTPLPSRRSPEERVAAPVPPLYTLRVEEALQTPASTTGTPAQAEEFWPVPPYVLEMAVPFQRPEATVPRYEVPELESAVVEA